MASSTKGYCHGMGEWQCRQRPRRSIQDTTGTLSRGAIGTAHDRQAEEGAQAD